MHPEPVADLSVRLGSEGDILAWLVAGPYPNKGALQLRGTGFRTDYLGGEAEANPHEGQTNGAFHWQLSTGTVKRGIDLKGLFRWNDPGIAYCFATIVSPNAQTVRLLFGSDDGAKVYLNGNQVFAKQIARGIKRDEDSVALTLRKGNNRLLFKIEQGDGDWGLMARLVGGNGLTEALAIDPTRHDSLSSVRRIAGSSGAWDVHGWQEYRTNRERAIRFLAHLKERAHEPERLEHALTRSAREIDATDSNLDRLSLAAESSAKLIGAEYDRSRAPLVKWAQHPGPLFAVESTSQDWLTIMKGGRYFAHRDGKPFIPIGANHNPDWPELVESDPLRDDYDPARTDRWFAKLAANGVNVIRLMVETPPSGNLEDPVGTIRPEHLIWLDNIVRSARDHGIRLWMTPYDTFWMSLRKETSPYWSQNGGPIEKPIDFLTSRKLVELEKRRLKFLVDRYGNTDTIFAWEIMNEIDLWWGGSPEQIRDWVAEVAKEIRLYEAAKWGHSHLLTVSFSSPEPAGLNAETAFRRRDLDFATMHLYLGASRATRAGQAEQAGADFAEGVVYARGQLCDDRPVLDGESGPIDHWIDDEALDDQVFHDMSWAHLMAGGAGPGTRWPYRNPHHVTDGMLHTLKVMNQFCAESPWHDLAGRAEIKIAVPNATRRLSTLSTPRATLAWFRINAGTQHRSFDLQVPPGATKYRAFDISEARWLGPTEACRGRSTLTFSVPADSSEIAVWIGR
ncbi:MAG: cellulase family glycosylhydrolase [Fimbriimonas sp.]|nr:cellulase family glycosylhydrolase [Fimbriimonas sp.]